MTLSIRLIFTLFTIWGQIGVCVKNGYYWGDLRLNALLWLIRSVQVNPALCLRNNNLPPPQTHLQFDYKGGNWANSQIKWGREGRESVYCSISWRSQPKQIRSTMVRENRTRGVGHRSPWDESGRSLSLRCELRRRGKLTDSAHGSYKIKRHNASVRRETNITTSSFNCQVMKWSVYIQKAVRCEALVPVLRKKRLRGKVHPKNEQLIKCLEDP